MKNILWPDWLLIALTLILLIGSTGQLVTDGYSHDFLLNLGICCVVWFLRLFISIDRVDE